MSVLVRDPGMCMAPADALTYVEQLQRLICDEPYNEMTRAMNTIRYAVARNIPVAPKFSKGRSSQIYDMYTCRRCGAIIKYLDKYCRACGQEQSDCYLGRRKTGEEARVYQSKATIRAMDDLERSFSENNDSPDAGAIKLKLADFIEER